MRDLVTYANFMGLPQDATLATAIVTRQQGKWYVVFSVETAFAESCGTGTVGIDLGLNSLVATSDGETIRAPRYARRAQTALRRRQRQLARCKIGSKRRLKAKARLAAASARANRSRQGRAAARWKASRTCAMPKPFPSS